MRFGNAVIALTCKKEKTKNQNIFYEVCEGILFGETSKTFRCYSKTLKIGNRRFLLFFTIIRISDMGNSEFNIILCM